MREQVSLAKHYARSRCYAVVQNARPKSIAAAVLAPSWLQGRHGNLTGSDTSSYQRASTNWGTCDFNKLNMEFNADSWPPSAAAERVSAGSSRPAAARGTFSRGAATSC